MANKEYLKSYLKALTQSGKTDMASSIEKTAKDFAKNNLYSFSFSDHEIGLLFGNVQAGKTAQMFGIMCAAADSSFPLFIILTTDNVALQKQTYDRVVNDLSDCDFCICGELDKQKFVDNALSKPTVIVLKKNSKVLLQWYNTLASSSFVIGNALFVIDDEADAASPNTLVNSNRVSTINKRLNNIRNASVASMYLQVTGTPQALLLQSSISSFRPSFTCYFEPGNGYLGGDYFFDSNDHIRFIDDYPDSKYKDGLFHSLLHHLVSSAILLLAGEKVCNFVVHPGVKKAMHLSARNKITEYISYLKDNYNSDAIIDEITDEYEKTSPEKCQKPTVQKVRDWIRVALENNEIKVLIMNGDTNVDEGMYSAGSNIIIGGNVLGRGVTFPKLQTLYYSRTAKKPQADTMWQHSRMVGYDRDGGLMQVYITKQLYKLFSNINAGNNSIISQVNRGMEKIQLFYPEGINPTRKNVIDMGMVNLVAGGANYYPNDPDIIDMNKINEMLKPFDSKGYYQVGAKMILEILNLVIPSEDFNIDAFKNVIKARLAENPSEQSILIVRREREVTQGTGSLLSPNDRELGASFADKVVLTVYQISGNHGWKRDNIWVPNIKLPDFINYYDVH